MKKYVFQLRGTGTDKLLFTIGFMIACVSVVFIPLAVIALIQNIEVVEYHD